MTNDKKLRLFEFCGADYVVAYNLRQAVRCWQSTTWGIIREALEESKEIPSEKWKKYKFIYDHEKSCSFEKRIKEVLETKEEKVPFFLASSEY